MGVVRDLTGQNFNGIIALHPTTKNKHNKQLWLFKCRCGKEFETVGTHIVIGHTKSCGCAITLNPDRGSLFYYRWQGMKSRCAKPEDPRYKHYGGRGIKVCERWHKYINFKEDMFSTFKEHLSLDRIDVNGDYCPENCRWATITEQNRNKRNNTIIDTPKGKMTIIEAAETFGIKETALHYRIKNQPYALWFVEKYASWKSKKAS